MTMNVSEAAIAFGKKAAEKKFTGRKGHGGAPVSYVTLTQLEYAALAAFAFEQGAKAAQAKPATLET